MDKISVKEKFEMIHHYWEPKIIGELNDSYVKLAKFKDEFVCHIHEHECLCIPALIGCHSSYSA